MALQTKTVSQADSNGRSYTLTLYLEEVSTDINTNTSSIYYRLSLSSGGWNYYDYGTGWSVYINGTRVNYMADNGTDTGISKYSSITLCSGSTTVTHNTDGTKSISGSANLSISTGGSGPGDISLSFSNWALTAIPRASDVTMSDGTLNTSQNITITPKVASYKHTLTYTCGSTSGTIGSDLTGSTSGFNKAWTPPLSLAAQNTTGTTVAVTVTCETFNGSTSIGTKSVTVSMTIPASVKPSVSMTLSDPMGYLTTYGAYVQNKSKLTVALTTTTSQGASIASYTITVGSLTYSTNGVTTDVLPESGTIAVTTTITDTRGRSGTATSNITVVAYSPPSITDIGIYRSNSSGTALPTGAYATVTFKATVAPMTVSSTNKNTATYKLESKVSSASSYTSTTLTTYNNNFNVTNGKATFSANISNSYDARITITDKFGTVTSIVVRVQSSAAYFKIDAVNNGFTFGKLETAPNTFTCAWAAVFDSTVSIGDIGDLKTAINSKATLLQCYPVGAIYISTVNTSPATLFGGTWEQIQGTWLVASGASANGQTYTAGTSYAQQLPNIKGKIDNSAITRYSFGRDGYTTTEGALTVGYNRDGYGGSYGTESGTKGTLIFDASDSNSVYTDDGVVRPTSLAVYMWKRTA